MAAQVQKTFSRYVLNTAGAWDCIFSGLGTFNEQVGMCEEYVRANLRHVRLYVETAGNRRVVWDSQEWIHVTLPNHVCVGSGLCNKFCSKCAERETNVVSSS